MAFTMQSMGNRACYGLQTLRKTPVRSVRPTARTKLVAKAQAQAAAAGRKMKPVTGRNVVRIRGDLKMDVPVATLSEPGLTLTDYMHACVNFFDEIELPLGSRLEHVEGDIFNLAVPGFNVLDISIQPLCRSVVSLGQDHVAIHSNECTISGSHHVKDLNINERFGLEVNITFTWQDTPGAGKVATDGYLEVDIDLPMPFSLMPRAVLETAGNTAMGVSLNLLLSTFVKSLAQDYERWVADPALRERRAERPTLIPKPAAASGTSSSSSSETLSSSSD